MLHVMAGLLIDTAGRVLLAQRPPGKQLAGQWEFPGGKREPGEAPWSALVRELHEELGIIAKQGEPLIRIPWRAGERELLLDAWLLRRWQASPRSMEGQALRWSEPAQIDPMQLTPADRPVLQALRLPHQYWITPDCAVAEAAALEARIKVALAQEGVQLLQLRLPRWPAQQVRALTTRWLPEARRQGVQFMLNADIDGARELGVGVQLKSIQLSEWATRPLPYNQWVGASCHDQTELAQAAELGADFATLSPLRTTASHPGAAALGWPAFAALVDIATLPVYALGGLGAADIEAARRHGAQGVAGIGGFWRQL